MSFLKPMLIGDGQVNAVVTQSKIRGSLSIDARTTVALNDLTLPGDSLVIHLERLCVGLLNITTGKIVACDPLGYCDQTPFSRLAPQKDAQVELLVAHFANKDQRIAIASLRFTNAKPVRWEMATKDGQSVTSLGENEIFGYGVDTGTGGFMDLDGADALCRRYEVEDGYFEEMIAALNKNYVHTRSWAHVQPDPTSPHLVYLFSSGVGDGFYASYWGFDENDIVCCLSTDFDVLRQYG